MYRLAAGIEIARQATNAKMDAKNPRRFMERLLTPIQEGRLPRVANWSGQISFIAKEVLAGQGERRCSLDISGACLVSSDFL
jgi:hypothetical protein